jgi:hypothetical protein
MKQSLSSLNFILKADITDFQTSLRAASTELKRTGQSMKSIGGNMSLYVTAPIAAATTAMLLLTNRSAEFADSIDEMSERTGVARETLQELSFVANQIGIDLGGIERALFKFNKSMGDAARGSKEQAEAFTSLGVSVVDNSGELRDYNDVFTEVIGKLSQMTNETQRNYTTMVLFGRGAGQTITPLLELGEQGLQQLIDRARELGVVMSDEQVKSLAEYNDAMDATRDQVAAVGRELSMNFAKVMTDTIIPLLQDQVIPAVRSVTKWFNELSPGVKNNILIFGAFAAALGPVIMGIGILTSNVIPALLMGIRGIISAYTFLTGVIAANPIGAFAVFITAAATALGLFSTRTREAAQEQHKLGEEIRDVNNELGKQIWEQVGVRSAEKLADGTLKVTDNMAALAETIKNLTRGELEALKSFLKNEYATVTREAANETSELRKTLYADDLNRLTQGLDMVNKELSKYKEVTSKAKTTTQTLEDEISGLTDKLWKQVQANDADMGSTARLLKVKKDELEYLKEKMRLLSTTTRMDSILPNQVQVDPNASMGPPTNELLFEREIEQTSAFSHELEKLSQVSVDVSQAIQGAISQMASQFGKTLGELIAGTATTSDLFNGLLDMIGNFLTMLGEALIASAVAAIAFENLLSNPYAAMAAGIALVALGALVSNILSAGPNGSQDGGFHQSPQGSIDNIPRAANGAVVDRPTILMAGEGGEAEAVLPINYLMSTIHNAVSMRNISGISSGMEPVLVKVEVEGQLKGSEIYLMNKRYTDRINQLK